MGKQKTTAKNTVEQGSNIVAVRFAPELLARLDGEVEKRLKAAPWLETSRASLIREALYKLLGEGQTSQAPTPKASSKQATPKQAAKKASSSPKKAIEEGHCKVCGDPLPPGHKTICAKPRCKQDDKNARERERRKELRQQKPSPA